MDPSEYILIILSGSFLICLAKDNEKLGAQIISDKQK